MSQSEGKYKSVTPTESQERPTKGGNAGSGNSGNVRPVPELFQNDESSDDQREELGFQFDCEMDGDPVPYDGENMPNYESSEDEDESKIPDDEVGHVVILCKVIFSAKLYTTLYIQFFWLGKNKKTEILLKYQN